MGRAPAAGAACRGRDLSAVCQGSGVVEMDELLLRPSLLSTHNSFLVQRLGRKAVLASKICELNLEASVKIFFFWLVGFSPSLEEIAWLQTPLPQFFRKK